MFRLNKISWLFLLVVLCSCGRFSEITVGEIYGVNIIGFDDNSLLIGLNVPIENPTMHRITITGFDTRLYMNGQYVGKINLSEEVALASKTDMVYELVLHVRLANFISTAMGLMSLRKGQRVIFRIEGALWARTILMKRRIAIDETREVII